MRLIITSLFLFTQLAFANGNLQNADFATAAQITGAGGTISQLLNTSKIFDSTNSQLLDTTIAGKQPTGNYITALTGDVTAAGPGSVASTIANSAVTNAKMANMNAHTYKGNNTGSAAAPLDVTSTQLTADLNLFTSGLQGLAPASGGGTVNFLRADGAFAAPPSNYWTTTGNAGLTAGTNFSGTTDAVDYVMKRNSVEELRLGNDLIRFSDSNGTFWKMFPGSSNWQFTNNAAAHIGFALDLNNRFYIYDTPPRYFTIFGAAGDSGTDPGNPTAGVSTPILELRNADTTVNNFDAFASSNASAAHPIDSEFVGVHDNHSTSGSQTGHAEIWTANAGTLGRVASFAANKQVTFDNYGAGVAQFSAAGLISSTAPGSSGNLLTSNGAAWVSSPPATNGTVTTVSVVSANGFAGTVANPTTAPAITISTTCNGICKANGTAISTATANTDYQAAISTSAAVTNQFVTGFTAPNTFTRAQPAFSDLSGNATNAQMPTYTNHAVVLGTGAAGLGVTAVGATNTVLHGNTGADPTYSAIVNADITNATIDLTTKVTGVLPVANATISTQAISASAIDWATGNVFTKTLGANTTFTFSNQTSGQTIVVRLTNTASNYTVTWPGGVLWSGGVAPTQTVGAKSDVYTFVYDGTNTYGSAVQNF